MNFFAALLTIASVATLAKGACPSVPNCEAGKKICNLFPRPDGCPPAPLCLNPKVIICFYFLLKNFRIEFLQIEYLQIGIEYLRIEYLRTEYLRIEYLRIEFL